MVYKARQTIPMISELSIESRSRKDGIKVNTNTHPMIRENVQQFINTA